MRLILYILLMLPFYLYVISTFVNEANEQEKLRKKFARERKKYNRKIHSVEIRVIVLEVIAWIAAALVSVMFLFQIIVFLLLT